uniref:Uncharacterized protein n=1 Tax=Paenibacillus athensensis TaxID=1967502 RepID=A0A4Y8Q8R7_9BACL
MADCWKAAGRLLEGCWKGCWKTVGGLLEGCRKVAGKLLEGYWRVAGRLLEDFRPFAALPAVGRAIAGLSTVGCRMAVPRQRVAFLPIEFKLAIL